MYKMATVGGGGGWRIFLGIFIRLYRVADRLWQVGSEAVCCPTASWMERNGLTRQFVTVTTTDPPSGSNCAPSRAIQCGVCAYFIAQRALFPPLCCECECFYLWKTSEHSSVAGLSTDFFFFIKKKKKTASEFIDVQTKYQFSPIDRSLAANLFLLPEQKGRPVSLCKGLFFISFSSSYQHVLVPYTHSPSLSTSLALPRSLAHTRYMYSRVSRASLLADISQIVHY